MVGVGCVRGGVANGRPCLLLDLTSAAGWRAGAGAAWGQGASSGGPGGGLRGGLCSLAHEMIK